MWYGCRICFNDEEDTSTKVGRHIAMNKYVQDLKKLLGEGKQICMHGDTVPYYQYSMRPIDEISALQATETMARYIERGFKTQTVAEARQQMQLKLIPTMLKLKQKQMNGDDLYNSSTGFGTLLDPNTYTRPIMPIMCGAGEASAIYAGGGLPASIVDKKSTSMIVQGATFVPDKTAADFWSDDKVTILEDAAVDTGFTDEAGDRIKDAYLYGGAILYPILKGDTPSRYLAKVDKMHIEKGSIIRWTGVDRWNTVYVPSFIPTAADYLTPKTIMVLQESVEVSTSRMCIIRPKPMPYWSAIVNMGWSPSDLTGWIQAYYAYETTQMAIPVMAQQMSLLLYRMPLDALNATVGVNGVEKLMAVNEAQMKSWSSLSPKAVNMVGEVEVVDRTYSGFDQFVGAIKSNFAAQTEIPEPSIWHTPNKGFSDNTQESLIKQSETLQMRQHYIERYMSSAKDLLIAHCFGSDSEEFKNRHSIKLKFAKPEITTEKDLADVGAKYAAAVNSLVQAGFTPDLAVQTAKQFFPKVEMTDEMIAKIKSAYEETKKQEMEMQKQNMQMQAKQGNGNTGKAKTQSTRKTEVATSR